MTTKLFYNGRSQAVRLPKEYRFDEKEVTITKVGGIVMLIPKKKEMESFVNAIEMFSDDFMNDGRNQDEQEREEL